jgi:SAM-dependent methyltransferase
MEVIERTSPDRRRQHYKPLAPQEAFIVPLIRQHLDALLGMEPLNKGQGKRCLDVGCGGQPLRPCVESLSYTYYGLDVVQTTDESIDFVAFIDQELPAALLAQPPFDLILCTEVLEHVADWDRAFANLARLLAARGHLLITCPMFYQLHEEPYDFWRPTPYAFQFFADRYGLETVHLKKVGDAWDVLGTTLANVGGFAAAKTFSSRLAAKLFCKTRDWVLKLLLQRKIQRLIRLAGPLYQVNVALLRRPG